MKFKKKLVLSLEHIFTFSESFEYTSLNSALYKLLYGSSDNKLRLFA